MDQKRFEVFDVFFKLITGFSKGFLRFSRFFLRCSKVFYGFFQGVSGGSIGSLWFCTVLYVFLLVSIGFYVSERFL